ncbi:hypothetical protein JXB22_05225 [candidate division WOR-3 bacterium]|nr:hypothetical protein [candidate division WOR-3 bacterium]
MITLTLVLLVTADFVVSDYVQDQSHPVVLHAHDQYYVYWYDMRFYSPERSIYAARISESGNVLDPLGKPILIDRTVQVAAAFDGVNLLAVIQDSC